MEGGTRSELGVIAIRDAQRNSSLLVHTAFSLTSVRQETDLNFSGPSMMLEISCHRFLIFQQSAA
eukprot:1161212-Pelagomonas_calceolata.AAC.16